MGGSLWSDDTYNARRTAREAKGYKTAFTHSADIAARRVKAEVHDNLNIKNVNVRESRDSDNHPESNAVAVLFDVTGSMRKIPVVLQEKLPQLMSMVMSKGYLTDPQLLFGGVGDATCDVAPIQIGQFESGVEMDECLGNIHLEGGGGNQKTESYELSMYFMANHVSMDCLEKRGKKGYLFLIGDEMPYDTVKPHEAEKHLGYRPQGDVTVEEVVSQLQESFEVFFIIPTNACNGKNPMIKERWVDLLGQNVLFLEDENLVCELISSTIGISEGVVDVDGALADLKDVGVADSCRDKVSTALSTVVNRGDLVVGTVTGDLSTDVGAVDVL